MEQSSSYDEKTVMHQFDRKCKLALKGEIVDYERHLAYLRKHETLFSELSCILQSPADSDAFQSGRCAKHNGRPETMYF